MTSCEPHPFVICIHSKKEYSKERTTEVHMNSGPGVIRPLSRDAQMLVKDYVYQAAEMCCISSLLLQDHCLDQVRHILVRETSSGISQYGQHVAPEV